MQNEQNGYLVLRKPANPRLVRLFRALVNACRRQALPESEMAAPQISRDDPGALKQGEAKDELQINEPQSRNYNSQILALKSTLRDLKKGFRLLKTNTQDKKRFRDRIRSIERKIRKWEHYKRQAKDLYS